MKAKFTALSERRCTVTYTHPEGGRVTREFIAPASGGYVRELRRGGDTTQVCRGLACAGLTLLWDGKAPLVDLIRKEFALMRRNMHKTED